MSIIAKVRSLYLPAAVAPKPLRKWSVVSHWFLGALCAYLIARGHQGLALVIMGMFGGMEAWNDKEQMARNPRYLPEGCTDFWDAFVVFIGGITLVAILSH